MVSIIHGLNYLKKNHICTAKLIAALGMALVAGKKGVPNPTNGKTALRRLVIVSSKSLGTLLASKCYYLRLVLMVILNRGKGQKCDNFEDQTLKFKIDW